MRVPGDLVLRGQPRAEQQRVVGAERDRHARLEQRAQRDLGRLGRDAERHVGGRAHLAGDASAASRLTTAGSSTARMPWPIRSACRSSRHAATLAGRPARRRAGPAAGPPALGDPERGGEVVRRAAPLVVGQAEPGHAAARVLDGQPGQGPGLQRVLGPVGRHDDADADPGRGLGLGRRSSTSSSMGVMPPNRRGEDPDGSTWISSQPEPSARSSSADLGQQPPHVGRGRAAPNGRCRTAAGTGTSRARRSRSAAAASPAVSAGGSRMPWRPASSTSVACRMAPVKCRCRCAFGSAASGRSGLGHPVQCAAPTGRPRAAWPSGRCPLPGRRRRARRKAGNIRACRTPRRGPRPPRPRPG